MRRFLMVGVATLFFFTMTHPATAAETIGVVRKTAGAVQVVRDGKAVPAAVGMKLLVADTIETGSGGSVGIILRDDSLVSLGADSSLALGKFQYAPAEGKLGLVARLSRGTLEYISGLIGKLAPESVRIDTPVSSIGIRGTHLIVKSESAGG